MQEEAPCRKALQRNWTHGSEVMRKKHFHFPGSSHCADCCSEWQQVAPGCSQARQRAGDTLGSAAVSCEPMAGEWLPRVTAATQLRHRECELQPPFQSVARDWINQEEIGQSPFTCGCPWAGLGACRHPTLPAGQAPS